MAFLAFVSEPKINKLRDIQRVGIARIPLSPPEASRDIPGRTVDELNGHYAECRPSNRFARFGGGLNAVPHILNGDGEPLLLTGRDHNRYPLKGDYFSF